MAVNSVRHRLLCNNEEAQPIPVRISNGSRGSQESSNPSSPAARFTTRIHTQSRNIPSSTRCEKKILLLGDWIIGGVNTRGLVTGVHKNPKGGATVQNLIDEVSLYDMKAFSAVILYISGNDAASGKDPEWIADKYDQLISLIRCSNNDSRIIFCSLVHRGDVDVTKMNQIISELATHWKNQRAECASECYDIFFKGGQLST